MDIQEYKKLARNKLEADALTKQVRDVIKITKWQKQDAREGFKESFNPLISQFEKPEDPQTKNIFTQNQEMLKNQRVLTEEAINKNKAIKKLTEQYERLADIKELPGSDDWVPMQPPDDEGDPWDSAWVPVPKPSGNLEKTFVGSELIFFTGNNGVLSEYIQIAHQLRDLGVVTNNQLNKLLKNYIPIIKKWKNELSTFPQ